MPLVVSSNIQATLLCVLHKFLTLFSFSSPVVKVYRRCLSKKRWTSVDFSGCVMSSGEQQVLVIISLQAIITSDSDSSSQINISRLNDEVSLQKPLSVHCMQT